MEIGHTERLYYTGASQFLQSNLCLKDDNEGSSKRRFFHLSVISIMDLLKLET